MSAPEVPPRERRPLAVMPLLGGGEDWLYVVGPTGYVHAAARRDDRAGMARLRAVFAAG